MSSKSSNEKLAGRYTKPVIDIFSTCPQSSQVPKEDYLKNVADVARWSEQYGCKGILVYTDNSLIDAWLVSQLIIQSTSALCPLVAVQPVYMHPYTVAKMAASYGYLYNRRIFLNMVAGGFKNDLTALNDTTPHDRRYDRMIEYVHIIKELLANPNGISFEGEFYKVDKLKMTPPLSSELFPGIFVSGSSEAGLVAAKAMGATAVKYPKPPGEYENEPPEEMIDSGVRVGIITREDEDEAWRIAHERFPADRKGELTHQLAMKVSDSVWHKQLSDLGKTVENNPYWLVPFQHYKTFCPYLVGSYTKVAAELTRYIDLGFQTFILDIPPNEEELYHIGTVFKLAIEKTEVKGVAS
jgi:alkanesulfonate monooxygenase